MNKIVLCGNLTRDPELNETPNGIPVCKFGLAVQRRFSKEDVDFFNIVAWRGTAENCNKFLKKGNKALITGAVEIRTYEAQDGSKRTSVDVVADEVEFLTPKGEREDKPKLVPVNDDEQLPF